MTKERETRGVRVRYSRRRQGGLRRQPPPRGGEGDGGVVRRPRAAGDAAAETREGGEVREISCSRDKLEFLIFVLRSSTSRPRWPLQPLSFSFSPSLPLCPRAPLAVAGYMGQPIYQSLINWVSSCVILPHRIERWNRSYVQSRRAWLDPREDISAKENKVAFSWKDRP